MHSILPMKITVAYENFAPGQIVLVSGCEKSELLKINAGVVFKPLKPMRRSEFAFISRNVLPAAIAPGVLIDELHHAN